MHQAAFVREEAVAANKWLASDGSLEGFHAEHVLHDLLSHLVDLGVQQRYVVVAGDDISERRESFFDPLDADGVGEGVADHLKFHVGRDAGHEQALRVGGDQRAYRLCLANACMHDRHHCRKFLVKDRVEVL